MLSLPQLLVSGALLVWVILNCSLFFAALRKAGARSKWSALFFDEMPGADIVLAGAALLAFALTALLIVNGLSEGQVMGKYRGYIVLLTPLIHLALYVSLETVAIIVFHRVKDRRVSNTINSGFVWKALIVLAIFGLTGAVIATTGLGITLVYMGDWGFGSPAVPLLEWQILLACLFSIGLAVAETGQPAKSIRRLDLWIALFVWLGAVAIWLSHPVVPHPSVLEPRQPNYEAYPFGDSKVYDFYAQSMLVGNGFGTEEVPLRPLYIVFLTWLHVLVGQNLERMITAQSLVFSLFPVLLYFFGKELFGRPIGISVALLAALRDYTSNLVAPFTGNLSYSKVFLSEMPTAMILVLFTVLGIRWIRAGFPSYTAWLMGGVLGIGMLIRTQAVVALPVIALFGLLAQAKRIAPLARGMGIMVLSTMVVVGPWIWRNWKLTGEFMFDSPQYQVSNLALRYSRINGVNADILIHPGESVVDYNARLWTTAREAISSNPTGALRGVASYFLNHCVNNILLFPLRHDLRGLGELVMPTHAFWQEWTGQASGSQVWVILIYVSLLGLGVAAAWHRNGWVGLLPLGMNLAYNLWTSMALLGGGRFMLSMDWSVMAYYMVGLFAALSGFMYVLQGGGRVIREWYEINRAANIPPAAPKSWRHYALTGLLFFVIGASLPWSETAFPKRYPLYSQNEIGQFISEDGANLPGLDAACLHRILDSGQAGSIQGRAMYPRFYEAGQGESFTDALGYQPYDEGRLVFELVGQRDVRIILPMTHAPEFFPNASDVIVIGTEQPWIVIVRQGKSGRVYLSGLFDPSICR